MIFGRLTSRLSVTFNQSAGGLSCALFAATLSACAAVAEDQKAQNEPEKYPIPPEYISCRDVPAALAQADAIVRKLGLYSTTREGAYWAKRQERLVARAYQCKNP